MSAVLASTNQGEYCLSKSALSMATKLWAARLGEFGLPVYEVRPGIIPDGYDRRGRDNHSHLLESGLAIERRWGTPDDVGSAVAALARGDVPYSSGHVVLVDGGPAVSRL